MTNGNSIPQHEIDEISRSIICRPELFDTAFVIGEFRKKGLHVIADPHSGEIIKLVQQALSACNPLSVLRFGDGEINLLSYGAYFKTPQLNAYAAKKIIDQQQDTFEADSTWMIILRELMMASLLQADIVGVLGVWRDWPSTAEERAHAPKQLVELLKRDIRGVSGYWRGPEYMLQLAYRGLLNNKTIAPAHLYFAILDHLDDLITYAQSVVIISNRQSVPEKLSQRHAGMSFEFIAVGEKPNTASPGKPDFLSKVHTKLPESMSGCLALVGAGPWSEIYCTWIKQRGGVAIDVGSGFDLLEGLVTRPIHKWLGDEKADKYKL
ncbi:hypothetical protein ACFL33_02115 [Pseudomonadota bacterium]